MNRKYIFHPRDYFVGENEKLYGDMAAKGWLLEKRGPYLSRFHKAEPAQLRYRVELASPDTVNGETVLPEEQLALYEECGWRYVTGNVYIHVFSAPENSDVPEIYTDPRQQASTLKGQRRRYFFGWVPLVLLLPFNLLIRFLIPGGSGNVFERFVDTFKMGLVAYTAFFLLYAVAALWAVYTALHGSIRLTRLYRQLKRGRPIDHAPKRRNYLHPTVSAVLLFFCVVIAAMSIVQIAQHRKYDMPTEADGPYLLLQDLGWTGARSHMLDDHYSYVETDRSLLASHWHTYECVAGGNGNIWMYQDVYVLHDKKLAGFIVPYHITNATFTRDAFKHVDIPGLDDAYVGRKEYIAVKGNTVYKITYDEPGSNADQEVQADVLHVLAEMG